MTCTLQLYVNAEAIIDGVRGFPGQEKIELSAQRFYAKRTHIRTMKSQLWLFPLLLCLTKHRGFTSWNKLGHELGVPDFPTIKSELFVVHLVTLDFNQVVIFGGLCIDKHVKFQNHQLMIKVITCLLILH